MSKAPSQSARSSSATPIGFFHIDIAEVQTGEGKLYLFVGIDRTSKFAVAQLVATADRRTAWRFLQHMLETVPYQVHTILSNHGIQFAGQPRNRNTIYSRPMRFDMICEASGIEHRLTKPNHLWTNGQVERMNRTIKDQPLGASTTRTMTSYALTSPTSWLGIFIGAMPIWIRNSRWRGTTAVDIRTILISCPNHPALEHWIADLWTLLRSQRP